MASGVLPPSSSACGSQTRHLPPAECPSPGPCCGPGADRGRTARGCVRSKAHSSTARALADVQTMPPCRPQKALRLAAELMYVTGIMSSVSITSASCSQQSSTCSMSAMSAIEQPAAMSGRTTVTRWPPRGREPLGPVGQDVGRLGHEVDAAEGDRPALAAVGGHLAELVAVAAQVGQGDHLVLLVVMAEDQAAAGPSRRGPRRFALATSRCRATYRGPIRSWPNRVVAKAWAWERIRLEAGGRSNQRPSVSWGFNSIVVWLSISRAG